MVFLIRVGPWSSDESMVTERQSALVPGLAAGEGLSRDFLGGILGRPLAGTHCFLGCLFPLHEADTRAWALLIGLGDFG
jgi:hypothetical protein